MPNPNIGSTRTGGNTLSLKQRFVVLAAGAAALIVPGCTPAAPNSTSTLDGPSPVAGGPVTPGQEQSSQQEQLHIAGDWLCMAAYDSGSSDPIRYPFSLDDSGGQWKMTRRGAIDVTTGQPSITTLPLVIDGGTISWYGDTGNNPKGWDVTIKLKDGGIDGASGSFINHYDDSIGTITDCQPYNIG